MFVVLGASIYTFFNKNWTNKKPWNECGIVAKL